MVSQKATVLPIVMSRWHHFNWTLLITLSTLIGKIVSLGAYCCGAWLPLVLGRTHVSQIAIYAWETLPLQLLLQVVPWCVEGSDGQPCAVAH